MCGSTGKTATVSKRVSMIVRRTLQLNTAWSLRGFEMDAMPHSLTVAMPALF